MAKLLLGKEVTAALNARLQAQVAELKEKGISPKLGILRCGENPSDLSYEKGAVARAALRIVVARRAGTHGENGFGDVRFGDRSCSHNGEGAGIFHMSAPPVFMSRAAFGAALGIGVRIRCGQRRNRGQP